MRGNAINLGKSGYPIIVPPAYTSAALLFCWIYLMFYATSAGTKAAAPISLYSAGYTVSALSMIITLVVTAFFVKRRTRFLTNNHTKIATGAGLTIGTALLITNSAAPNMALLVAGGVITGVFSGLLSLQWVAAYKRVGLRVAVGSFPALMAMSVGICATLMYLPHEVVALVAVALPLASELMFHEVRKEPWPHFEDEEAGAPNRPINFVLMLLPFAVYALATGFLDFSSADNSYTLAFYAFGAFIPVAIAGVYLFIVERDGFISAFVVPCAVLIIACVPLLTMGKCAPFSPFISIGELGIEVLLFIVPIGFAHFFSIDALKTYALGRMVYVVISAVGWYIAQFVSNQFGALEQSQLSLVIIFVGVEVLTVCLIVAIVKAQKIMPGDELGDTEEPVSQPTEDNTDEYDAAIQEDGGPLGKKDTSEPSIDDVFDEYGLSQREREVCLLLARGYTSPRIQKELFIAAGTVNYHSRNIYAKLGVHSKQELIELLEDLLP